MGRGLPGVFRHDAGVLVEWFLVVTATGRRI